MTTARFTKRKNGFRIKKRNSRVYLIEKEDFLEIQFIRLLDSTENVEIINNQCAWVYERGKIKVFCARVTLSKNGADELTKALVMQLYGTDDDILFRKAVVDAQ